LGAFNFGPHLARHEPNSSFINVTSLQPRRLENMGSVPDKDRTFIFVRTYRRALGPKVATEWLPEALY